MPLRHRAHVVSFREGCNDIAKAKQRAQQLKDAGSPDAKRVEEWIKWRDMSHYQNTTALFHALGLHRDLSRGRTHIVLRRMEYAPNASKDIRHRFRITHAGVFKISEIYTEIEYIMRLNRGKGKEYVDGFLTYHETIKIPDVAPALSLSYGPGIQGWLTSGT